MKSILRSIVVLWMCLAPVFGAGCSAAGSSGAPGERAGWKLTWQDEFDGAVGSAPDASKWGYDLGGEGWGNQEHEYYANDLTNASLDGKGALAITARKFDPGQGAGLACWYGPCAYTSARLLTKGKFEVTYGRVEARLKLPAGQGIWPAFWLLGADIAANPWPACGEIDIMENIGKEPDTVYGTVHGPGYSGANGVGGPFVLSAGKFADDFHVFAVEWEAKEIRWYVDGEKFFSVTPTDVAGDWAFNHPFFLLLNLAVGGQWPGYPNDTTVFPQTLLVDYVRVYQK